MPYLFKKRNSYVLLLVLIALILAISLPRTRNLLGARPLLAAVIYPFQYTADVLWRGVGGGISYLVELNQASFQNIAIRKELNLTQAQLQALEELKQENARLKRALNLKQTATYRLLAARVIGKSPAPWLSLIDIDRGKSSGVRADMPVIAKEGLVGRVIEVFPHSSKVMLLIDPESSVAAVNQRSRDFGVAQGALPNKLYLNYVDAKGEVEVGDQIVTSYLSDIFPAGMMVGQVLSVSKKEHDLFCHIELKPAVDFSKLEEVFVIQ